MSTRRPIEFPRRWRVGRALPVRLLHPAMLLLAAGVAVAATDVEFRPSVELRVYRDGNVRVLGDQQVTDEVAELSLDLALSAIKPPTTFTFSYSPYRQAYHELSELDNTGHLLSARLVREISQRSVFSLGLAASHTERQRVQEENPESGVTLVPRSTQDRASLHLAGRISAGRRSFFDWGAGADLVRYDDRTLADSDSVDGSIGWGLEVSQRADVGIRYGAQRIDVATVLVCSGDNTTPCTTDANCSTVGGTCIQTLDEPTTTQSLSVVANRGFGRNARASIALGAVRSTTDGETTTDPSINASYTNTFERGSTLTTGIRQRVSGGSGVNSATLDRGAYVSLRPGQRASRFETDLTAYYWQRETLIAGATGRSEIKTLETSESFAWKPYRRHFALGAFHSYHDQTDVVGPLDTSYHSGGAFFRWEFWFR